MPTVTVVMPVFEQESFLGRAIGSLLDQRCRDWELVVVDDGSRDGTAAAVRRFADPRIRLVRLHRNHGLGAACNRGLDLARAPLVTYLPADDVVWPDHLDALVAALGDGDAMAVTGVRHHGDRESLGAPDGYGPQLVQVLHRRTPDRWTERAELETDDLDRLFWSRLRARGGTAHTGVVTCEWVDHPGQRHKVMRESYDGGLNVFRGRYGVREPLRFRSTDGGEVDEVALYAPLRERPYPPAADGLHVLLAGELAFNPERVLALAARGHRLSGAWTPDGLGDGTVGPLPFGHVREAGPGEPRELLRRLRPDVVYGLLNWRAVPYCAAMLAAARAEGVPFVWHFKEAPQRSIARGEWPLLTRLMTGADGVVVSTPEERDWFALALPGGLDPAGVLVVDGDLPSAHWLTPGGPPPKLSAGDGELHTVVVGRTVGIDAGVVRRLAAGRVHVHVYGPVRAPGPKGQWAAWVGQVGPEAARYLHLHPPVPADRWAAELGRYDAGWLHRLPSSNGGELRRASWDDLNSPARLGPLAIAGVPVLQPRHPGHVVAADRVVAETGAGLLYDDLDDLVARLHDPPVLAAAGAAMVRQRAEFTFERHAPALDALFRAVAGRPPRR